ncbi:MAG: putative ribonucleoside-diphosphate reductase subunit alpha [Prokaryotic dsDNA virus sp.]|nr:MAG: putative ribonucleoside-diphosphate reductase subunit alpha [Prokaryotic dsDNA virus sp.]|tara:strand:+ start:32354 stop:34036 length:1683 start_codon:yes stop_codon:yes gene_type:complete
MVTSLDVSHLPDFPEWANEDSQDMLKKSYLDCPSLKLQFERMALCASKWAPKDGTDWALKFFEMMWNGWYSNSSPCLSNLGNRRKGMPVSCSSQYVADSLDEIYTAKHETAMLTKAGFGTALHLDDVRPRGSLISGHFKSNGVLPIIQGVVQDMSYVSQGHRRGSVAFYLSTEHGDFKEVCSYLKNNPKDLNIGFNITEDFSNKLQMGCPEALEKYQDIMLNRYTTGKGYLMFLDKSQEYLPLPYKREGLKVRGNNLCTELNLPTDGDYTFNCTLGSLNVAKYDEWPEDLVKTAIVYLDCVNSEFLDMARGQRGFEKIVKFAERFRPVGLGQMGIHTLMQRKSIPFGSFESIMLNLEVARKINIESLSASEYLAQQLGEPEGCKGLGIRMASRVAIAPTKSSSNIMGGVSQGIEQYFGCAFVEPLSTGFVIRENPAFVELLKSKGIYSKELMNIIATEHMGSCQWMEELTQHEKNVFRCVFEVNQMDVLKLAAMRQKHIDQMQSINLTFGPYATPEEISAVHKEAILNPDILSLYYCRRVTQDPSGSIKKQDLGECLACE